MKPTPDISPTAQKFPFVEYCYHSPMLNPSSAPRVKKSNSLRDISRDYFDKESNYDFLSDAAVFGTLIATAAVPIVLGVNAVIELCRALPF